MNHDRECTALKVRRPVADRVRELQDMFLRFGIGPAELALLARAGVDLTARGLDPSDVIAIGLEALADLVPWGNAPAQPPRPRKRPAKRR
jgi:hypothetical protein